MNQDNANSQALYYFDPDEAIFGANTQDSDFGGGDFTLPPHSQVDVSFNDDHDLIEVISLIPSDAIRIPRN